MRTSLFTLNTSGDATAIVVREVPNEYGACPRCGAYWGNPNPALNFPNRQKVDQHWKCYNPDCSCGFYDPETNRVVESKPIASDTVGLAAQAARMKEITDRITAELADKIWISRGNEHRPWDPNLPIPEGWNR